MKKTIKLINAVLLIFLITTYSCKKDDEIVITLDDLEVTIDENPTDGQVIGTVQGNGSNKFTFSIESQTPNEALNINANTGELTVADPTLFDFETNPTITATVSASEAQNTATVTINLNDVDEIVAQDVNLTIDENPSNGDVIGALQATAGSNLTYSISFQNPSGAFTINQSTGEISVADETLFDFETNPNMLATISISNGTYSVSKNAFVALNDLNEIGEFKYGGVIFWINASSNEGLVCNVSNIGTTSSWGCIGTFIGATNVSIGGGEANTNLITANCNDPNIAANIVENLNLNGFDDWYLPNIGEFNEMYTHKQIINTTAVANGGNDFSNFYWTSNEATTTSANSGAFFRFTNGTVGETNKGNILFVRAVRAWSDL